MLSAGLLADLGKKFGGMIVAGDISSFLQDSTEMQGLAGYADAAVAPASVEEVQELVRWCYDRGVPMVPRGGGTGFAGGAVPFGGLVVSMHRLAAIRTFDPELWRIHVDAGVTTGRVHKVARESGLMFPPDPGASEQSQIGGNIACNAGGPHSFKYGVTRNWLTGVEAVMAGGELARFGGAARKDVAGYDLRSLLAGSEGTLGIITGAWLRLIPAPEVQVPVVAAYTTRSDGVTALQRVYGFGLQSAVLEYLDSGTLAAARAAYPGGLPESAGFLVIAEADGGRDEAEALARGLDEALGEAAIDVRQFRSAAEQRDLWRWRSGVSFAVRGQRGGKMSEDVAVPFDRLEAAFELGEAVGQEAGLPTCSWGHAGDGNLHLTFLIDAASADEVARAARAADSLFDGVIALGGTISGEHGLGLVKREALLRQLTPAEAEIQRRVKLALDPKNLFNPGKKVLIGQAGGDSSE